MCKKMWFCRGFSLSLTLFLWISKHTKIKTNFTIVRAILDRYHLLLAHACTYQLRISLFVKRQICTCCSILFSLFHAISLCVYKQWVARESARFANCHSTKIPAVLYRLALFSVFTALSLSLSHPRNISFAYYTFTPEISKYYIHVKYEQSLRCYAISLSSYS